MAGQTIACNWLKKKVSRPNITVLEANKGKHFIVVDVAMYMAMSRDNMSKDRVVEPEDVGCAQRIISRNLQGPRLHPGGLVGPVRQEWDKVS